MTARDEADDIALEEIRNEFRAKAKQLFDHAFEYYIEIENPDLATIVNNFREAAAAISSNIPKDAWTSEDYELMMRASVYIISELADAPEQNEFSIKDETDYAIQMYQAADHSKLNLDYYLEAYEASVNFVGDKANEKLKLNTSDLSISAYAAYAKQTEAILQKISEKISGHQSLPNIQLRKLANANKDLADIYYACGQFEKALVMVMQAVSAYVSASDFDLFDLLSVAEMYGDLARMFAFDSTYAKLFQFASDLFYGQPEADFLQFEKVVYTSTRQPDAAYQRNQVLLQIMSLWNDKHELLFEPVFSKEMQEAYCQERFKQILNDQLAFENGYLHELFDPAHDPFLRDDDARPTDLQTFDEMLAQCDVKIPSLDEIARPAPGLLRRHSVFRVENSQTEAPKQGMGREIPVFFGPQ